MARSSVLVFLLAFVVLPRADYGAEYVTSELTPPSPHREFRGAWVATVANIDWPSKAGLPSDQQQSELLAILDRAVELRLNAVVLQVRPACDALYNSRLEPWSEYLTGEQGLAPSPAWDPLEFAVKAAHQRGLELHAWFNPYRAKHATMKGPVAPNHISRTHPELVKTYGRYLWLDPGEPAVRKHSTDVVVDVVRRYDVDGVHMDDYFYPYREKDDQGNDLDFPDEASWQRYEASGGRVARDDWRRENVNQFIRELNVAIHREKAWVKFGVSPFGIWRPGNPAQIKGFDQFAQLYADAKLWLNEGWTDYFSPQLYWARQPEAQSFPALLSWWASENKHQRHLWPGVNTVKSSLWQADEIVEQIRLTRQTPHCQGVIHWNMSALMNDRGGISTALPKTVYTDAAIVPPCPWLATQALSKPQVAMQADPATGKLTAEWRAAAGEAVNRWVLQCRSHDVWTTRVVPAQTRQWELPRDALPEAFAVYAVDRAGNLSVPGVLARP